MQPRPSTADALRLDVVLDVPVRLALSIDSSKASHFCSRCLPASVLRPASCGFEAGVTSNLACPVRVTDQPSEPMVTPVVEASRRVTTGRGGWERWSSASSSSPTPFHLS